MNILEVSHISKRFSDTVALDDVSMEVGEHRILGLLGPNGAGKTSLIRIINQITAPDEGEVRFRGEKLSRKHISQIGYLPEERGLYRKMKVGEQVIYLARLKGVSRQDAVRRSKYWFDKFEIASWWNRPVEELSKGMQQKLNLCLGFLPDPDLILLDEPMIGLDPHAIKELKEMISELRAAGKTILISTHIIDSVDMLWDRALIMKGGQIRKDVTKAELDEGGQNLEALFFEVTEGNEASDVQEGGES